MGRQIPDNVPLHAPADHADVLAAFHLEPEQGGQEPPGPQILDQVIVFEIDRLGI